uniref:NUA4L dehydrogenase n=1 Tax=Accipiter nisus TaxID=211598 RepID=A0A8B9S2Q9_9AVES
IGIARRGSAFYLGHYLIPLIGFISVGLGSAVLYLLRLALYSPDVSWDRKNNPEPWNKLSPTDQYKVSTGNGSAVASTPAPSHPAWHTVLTIMSRLH